MRLVENQKLDEERALYGADGLQVSSCEFDGPADGESALKEGRNIEVRNSYFNLRYPFWHDENLLIENSSMSENCRAALWYSEKIRIKDSKLHGIKALRECADVSIENSDIISAEFGWSTRGIEMKHTEVTSEYFMMRSDHLDFDDVTLHGKYSFQYITDSVFENCHFDTKDAFWHAENVVIRNSVIKGEYLAWYCKNVTFENCTLIGTQPLCYCKGLKLINCTMIDTDLAFEKSEVEATVNNVVESIKNPASGVIHVKGVNEIIMDDPKAEGKIIIEE